MLLSACLIVRDGGDLLADCLDALEGFADEVVVHDTGSVDGTLARLRSRPGVVVSEGPWPDDFAAARNVALAAARGERVLSVDADEVVTGDPARFRDWLAAVQDRALAVRIRNPEVDGGPAYEFGAVRLFTRAGARWRGRVHEQVVHDGDLAEPAGLREVPPELLRVDHHGYAGEGARRRKGERNHRLAAQELDALLADPAADPAQVARVVLQVGRSALGAGDRQRAVDAFEAVRELRPDGPSWAEATDYLARVLLGDGQAAPALVLADQLGAAGAGPGYCRWLRAQGLAQLGRADDALRELHGLTEIVDTAGRRHDPHALDRLRALCREALGEH